MDSVAMVTRLCLIVTWFCEATAQISHNIPIECNSEDDSVISKSTRELAFSLKDAKESLSAEKTVCQNEEKVYIDSFQMFTPRGYPAKHYEDISGVTHNTTNISCLHEKNPDLTRDIILPFFIAFSGKVLPINFGTTPFGIYKLKPKPDWMFLELQCQTEKEFDMCENITEEFTGSSAKFIFNNNSYSLMPERPSCSCQVTNSNVNSTNIMSFSAIDVRLAETMALGFQGCMGGNRRISNSSLLWSIDGSLCTSQTEMNLSMTVDDPQKIGDSTSTSVWLDLKVNKKEDETIMIQCGKVTKEEVVESNSLSEDKKDAVLGGIVIICIVLGSVALVGLIILVVCCVRRRSQDTKQSYDPSCMDGDEKHMMMLPGQRIALEEAMALKQAEALQDQEVIYTEPHRNIRGTTPLNDLNRNNEGQDYYELEHNYEEPGSPNNNFNKQKGDNIPPLPAARQVKTKEGIYNHLRERPDVVPSGAIYDTTVKGVYSSFKRQDSESHKDNIYD